MATWVSLFVVALLGLCSNPLADVQVTCFTGRCPYMGAGLVQREMRTRNINQLPDEMDQAKIPAQLGDAYQNDWTLVDQDMLPVVVGRSMLQNKSTTGTAPTSHPDPLNAKKQVNHYYCGHVFGCIGLTEWLHNVSCQLPTHMVVAKLGFLEIERHANTVRHEAVKMRDKVKALFSWIQHGQTLNEYPTRGFLTGMDGKGDAMTGAAGLILVNLGLVFILLWCLNMRRSPAGY